MPSPRARKALMTALVVAAAALIVLLGWLFNVLVQPAPPRQVVMSTGPVDGAYHAFALRYREHLARYRINLVLKPSDGSVENLARLEARREGVQVALLQGGIASAAEQPAIMTLGSLFYEPVWVFQRGRDKAASLGELRGKRIAVGPEGSGTRVLALRLLGLHGIDARSARLDDATGMKAAEMLEAGALDAAIFVAGSTAPAVRRLLAAPGIRLAGGRRAEAYVRQLPFLERLVLPAGAVDVRSDVPLQDHVLVAVTANLVAADDLHPVIVDLLLEAARQVHGGGSLLSRPGEFPAVRDRTFPVSEDAERAYRGELSFLRKILPFWIAIWVQRIALFLIPVLAIGLPLLRYAPLMYRWSTQRRLNRWYGELKVLENALRRDPEAPARYLERLDTIEDKVNAMSVPLGHSNDYYALRMHIALVREMIAARLRRATP